jgi:serine/threonine protein kinase
MAEASDDERLDSILADYIDAISSIDATSSIAATGHIAGTGDIAQASAMGKSTALRARMELRNHYLYQHPDLQQALQDYFNDEDALRNEVVHADEQRPQLARYSDLSRIGNGAMGVIYRAFDKQLQRWVALKTSVYISQAEEARFHREAQSMAKLRHPHIVPVFDAGEYQGRPYLSMALIDGTSLDQQLDHFRDDSVATAQLLVDIARAVHHAHQREILHRDLKPANIIVTQHNDTRAHPYVCDFGLAKIITDGGEQHQTVQRAATCLAPDQYHSTQGSVVGTAAYMSPEQASGEPATTLSDIYGLGAILYTLLAGAPPYRGGSLEDTLEQVKNPSANVTPLRKQPNPIDANLEAICLKCLQHNPELRYASAEGLARDLERWLTHRMTEARPLSRIQRSGLWCRRNPLGTGLIGVFLAFLTLLGLELMEQLDAPRRAQLALAEQRAESLKLRFDQLRQAVATTTANPTLASLFAARDRPGLQRLMNQAGHDRVDLNGISPFESWFAIDMTDGHLLARWPSIPALAEPADLRARHYIADLYQHADADDVTVSRAFKSLLDGLYKFGVSAPVLAADGSILGAVVATVTTSAQMGGFGTLRNDNIVTALLARREATTVLDHSNYPDGASDRMILLHPAYARRTQPVWFPQNKLAALASGLDENYRDPVVTLSHRAQQQYAGQWVAVFAPVADSEFIVVVQQRRSPILPPSKWLMLVLVCSTALIALLALRYAGHRQHRHDS